MSLVLVMETNALFAWHGYKVHVSETCEPEQVHLITQVQTTPAHIQDIEQTANIHKALDKKSLLPGQHAS